MILVVMPVFIVVLVVVLVTVIVVLAVVVLVCPGRDLSVFVFVGLALITLGRRGRGHLPVYVGVWSATVASCCSCRSSSTTSASLEYGFRHPAGLAFCAAISPEFMACCRRFSSFHQHGPHNRCRSLFKVHARDKQRNRPNRSICDLTASSTEAL